MAKQTGPNFITGTHEIACCYKWGDRYFIRTKSSLTAETVKKSDRFANSRKSASELAAASVIASGVYRSIPKEKRRVFLYRKMTGIAKIMLKKGKPRESILMVLRIVLQDFLRGREKIKNIKLKSLTFSLQGSTFIMRSPRHFAPLNDGFVFYPGNSPTISLGLTHSSNCSGVT